jgi:hypothetical protein
MLYEAIILAVVFVSIEIYAFFARYKFKKELTDQIKELLELKEINNKRLDLNKERLDNHIDLISQHKTKFSKHEEMFKILSKYVNITEEESKKFHK